MIMPTLSSSTRSGELWKPMEQRPHGFHDDGAEPIFEESDGGGTLGEGMAKSWLDVWYWVVVGK